MKHYELNACGERYVDAELEPYEHFARILADLRDEMADYYAQHKADLLRHADLMKAYTFLCEGHGAAEDEMLDIDTMREKLAEQLVQEREYRKRSVDNV